MKKLCIKYQQYEQHLNNDGEVIGSTHIRDAWFPMGQTPATYVRDSAGRIWVPSGKFPEHRTEWETPQC